MARLLAPTEPRLSAVVLLVQATAVDLLFGFELGLVLMILDCVLMLSIEDLLSVVADLIFV